jgi:hypothetical protein
MLVVIYDALLIVSAAQQGYVYVRGRSPVCLLQKNKNIYSSLLTAT